jgi:hypothetical protein
MLKVISFSYEQVYGIGSIIIPKLFYLILDVISVSPGPGNFAFTDVRAYKSAYARGAHWVILF